MNSYVASPISYSFSPTSAVRSSPWCSSSSSCVRDKTRVAGSAIANGYISARPPSRATPETTRCPLRASKPRRSAVPSRGPEPAASPSIRALLPNGVLLALTCGSTGVLWDGYTRARYGVQDERPAGVPRICELPASVVRANGAATATGRRAARAAVGWAADLIRRSRDDRAGEVPALRERHPHAVGEPAGRP